MGALGILSTILVGITSMGYLHQTGGFNRPAGVDGFCPFGGLETLYALVTTGALVKRIEVSSVILLGIVAVAAVASRRSFCGQICPLGFLQELTGRIGRRLFRNRAIMPSWLDRPARLLKYIVLAVFIALTWGTVDLAMRPYDPWVAWQHLTSAELLTEMGIGSGVLLLALVGSVVYDRFFCKYLCPMGAALGLMSKVSLLGVTRDADACIDCKICDRACPMNITVSEATTVRDTECISCSECVTACPAAGALQMTGPSERRLSPTALTALVIGIFVLGIGATALAGDFRFTVPSLEDRIKDSQDSGNAPAGTFDVMLIKGSTPLSDVAEVTGVPPALIEQVFGVPVAEQSLPIKDTKTTYGYTPEDVRTFVELYQQDPAAAAMFAPVGHEE
jgi:ferredoxin